MGVLRFVASLLISTFSCSNLLAGIIFQSSTLGQTEVTQDEVLSQTVLASNVAAFNFVGARFQVTEKSMVTRIGGHFVGGFAADDFFGAVVLLSSDSDLPDSDDLSTPDVLGTASLLFPNTSEEVFGNLTLQLEPGWYAVVFGTGLFEKTGRGGAVRNGSDINNPSYLLWQPGNGWFDPSFSVVNQRFVIEGHAVPEPSTVVLLATCGGMMLLKRRRTV